MLALAAAEADVVALSAGRDLTDRALSAASSDCTTRPATASTGSS
jgi:hypothetical protein